MEQRTQVDRDAITIEIGYALVSACFAAALSFGAVYGAAPVFSLSPATHSALALAGAVVATVVFALRVAHVLWRFNRGPGNDDR